MSGFLEQVNGLPTLERRRSCEQVEAYLEAVKPDSNSPSGLSQRVRGGEGL